MTVKIRSASGTAGINSIRVKGSTSTRRAARVKFRTGLGAGDLDQIFTGVDPIGLTISDADYVRPNNTTVIGTISVTATGGLAPFAYAWSVISYTAPVTPAFTAPSSASSTVIQPSVGSDIIETAVLRVTVTDAAGQVAIADKEASFYNISFS